MGACVGKLQNVDADSDAKSPIARHAAALDGPSSLSNSELGSDPAERCSLESMLSEEASSAAVDVPCVRHDVSNALAEAVDYWEADGRVRELSSEELADRYHTDNSVLLDTIEHLEEILKVTQKQAARGSVYQQEAATHSGDELQPPTPPVAESAETQAGDSEQRDWPLQEGLAPDPAQGEGFRLQDHALHALLTRDQDVANVLKDFTDGRMLAARKGLQEWVKTHSLELEDLLPYSDALGFEVSELLLHCKTIEEMLESLNDEHGYSVARDEGELRVKYKCVKGKVHHIKMEAILPHPLERPLALAREFDLMSSWNHYVLDSTLLFAPSIWQSWVYAALWMPFPFHQIDACGKGRGYDLSQEDRSLLVSMEDATAEDLPAGALKLPAKAAKRKRAQILPGSLIRLEALPPDKDGGPRTKGTVLAVVDPHFLHVPAFIVNYILGVVAPFAHRQIKHLLEKEFDDPSKPFPQRMAANPELYDRVREVVKAGLKKHYGVPSEAC